MTRCHTKIRTAGLMPSALLGALLLGACGVDPGPTQEVEEVPDVAGATNGSAVSAPGNSSQPAEEAAVSESEATQDPGGASESSAVDEASPGEVALDAAEEASGSGEAQEADSSTEPALPEGVELGNGRLVGGQCFGVCADASTDDDGTGALDGWGFENNESCLVPGSEPAAQGLLCDRPDLLPEPPAPAQIPMGNQPRPPEVLSSGFFVANGRLFDRLGNDFIMRGVNHPVVWFQNDALQWLDEIAETGANSVRLVWETDRGGPEILRQSIARAIELNMVPMVELHDVTGGNDVGQPAQMAQYYVDSLRAILGEFEDYLLVNIANEWGDFQTTDAEYAEAYRAAIDVLRGAGINHTLVIDGSNWGQSYRSVHNEGPGLLEYDAQHNVLFSVHMYESYENPQEMMDALNGAVQLGLPLIVGEFGFQHGNRGGQPIVLPFEQMLAESQRLGLGYLAWSWTGNGGGVEYLDLSLDGSAQQLSGWGNDMVNGPNGIAATSLPAGIFLQ